MTIRIVDHVMKSRQNTEIPYTCLEVRTRVYLEVSPRRGIYYLDFIYDAIDLNMYINASICDAPPK